MEGQHQVFVGVVDTKSADGVIFHPSPFGFHADVCPVHVKPGQALIKRQSGGFTYDQQHFIQRSHFEAPVEVVAQDFIIVQVADAPS